MSWPARKCGQFRAPDTVLSLEDKACATTSPKDISFEKKKSTLHLVPQKSEPSATQKSPCDECMHYTNKHMVLLCVVKLKLCLCA